MIPNTTSMPDEYITVTHGMSGYFAVLIKYYLKDGFHDVHSTGIGRYKLKSEAVIEAKQWSEVEELPYF